MSEYHSVFGSPEQMTAALGACKAAAEAEHGKPMRVKSTRQTHYHDKDGRDIYEVWATLEEEPLPLPPLNSTSV